MRNTSKLTSQEFEEVKISSGTADQIEAEIIKEHVGKIQTSFSEKEEIIIKNLLGLMSEEQKEAEKKYEYDARVKKEVDQAFNF